MHGQIMAHQIVLFANWYPQNWTMMCYCQVGDGALAYPRLMSVAKGFRPRGSFGQDQMSMAKDVGKTGR